MLPAVAERRKKQNAGPFPIALRLNKWDRMVSADGLTPLIMDAARPDLPESERRRTQKEISDIPGDSLDRFFRQTPPVPQLALATELEAVAGGRAYFRTFCVSALGPCRTETGADGVVCESPVELNPLFSIGLEDPFVWLAQLSDQLRLTQLEEHAATLRPWHLHVLAGGTPKILFSEHQRLSMLYLPRHGFAKRLGLVDEQLLKWFAAAASIAASVCCVVMIVAVLSMTAIMDSSKWRKYGPLLDAASQNVVLADARGRLAEAEEYVGNYVNPRWYRAFSYLLVRPRDRAAEYHTELKRRLTDIQDEELLLDRLTDLATKANATNELTVAEGLFAEVSRLVVNYHNGNVVNNPDVTARLNSETASLSSRTVEDLVPGSEISGLSGRLSSLSPDQTVTLQVSFLVEYGVFGTYEDNLGQYVFTGTLSDACESGTIRLPTRGGDADAVKNVVELIVKPDTDAGIPRVSLDAPGNPPELMDEDLL